MFMTWHIRRCLDEMCITMCITKGVASSLMVFLLAWLARKKLMSQSQCHKPKNI
jgi:hypothetical protein